MATVKARQLQNINAAVNKSFGSRFFFSRSGYSHDGSLSKSNLKGDLQAVPSLRSLLHAEILYRRKSCFHTTKNNEQPGHRKGGRFNPCPETFRIFTWMMVIFPFISTVLKGSQFLRFLRKCKILSDFPQRSRNMVQLPC